MIYLLPKQTKEVRFLPICDAGVRQRRRRPRVPGSLAPQLRGRARGLGVAAACRAGVCSVFLVGLPRSRALPCRPWRAGAAGRGAGQAGTAPRAQRETKPVGPLNFKKKKGGRKHLAVRSFKISDIYCRVYFCSLRAVYTIKLGKCLLI